MPLFAQALLFVAAGVLGTVGLVYVLRWRGGSLSMPGTSDPEAVYITVIGTLYAIFLAFMIFVVWTRFYGAMEAVGSEANALTSVFGLAEGLPQPLRGQVQQFCIDYADAVVSREWAEMARGSLATSTSVQVRRMWSILDRMNSDAAADPVLRDHIMTQWTDLTDLRRSRLLQSRVGLPSLLYAVMILGAVITVGIAALFHTESIVVHALKACLLAAMLSLMIFAVIALDRPFQGAVYVEPTQFEHVLAMMRESR